MSSAGNPNLLVPEWVEKELNTVPARAYDVAEADLLRDFYKLWEQFHAITNDKQHVKQKQEAAQAMVAQAHILRRFYAH